ncbi:hypothetical protein DFQ14_101413 [Halopolyspora algeriensis]|uniref:Uncharacterized protein n=1 Tax=Halopolyspora algeriensis TaxID=1500506 RepID=A0A368W073_9ACTN|nr:hypothetical protein [Halopolyspora algeriensis]RCW47069.1 hypothetical protein DFQ14_101413 [Halopolyspora algeriensis]TQM48156.1 hypothetical protein FHU43_3118 [Halopolyspora algeriensis]
MGLRRVTIAAATSLAALAAVPVAQAASVSGTAPPDTTSPGTAPLRVELGEVQCRDLSELVSAFPVLTGQLGTDPSSIPTVRYTLRAAAGSSNVPYTVTANGETKSTGSVGSGGLVSSGISLPNNSEVRIRITSGETVAVDRTVTTNC